MNERDLFLTALEIDDPAKRRLYLDSACGSDQALRSRVEALLASHAEAGSFMDQPAVAQLEQQTETPSGTKPEPDDTIAEPRSPSPGEAFAFLAPSDRPSGLGRLAHYEVLELVGKGAMGIVFKALDTDLQRVVAVKVLAPQLASSPVARQRFIREAHAAAAVAHENVVTIHAVESKQVPPYLVMQFVAGISLHDKLAISGPLTVVEICRIGCQAAAGLAAAHKQGLVHRDIKPANILLENGVERVKITDFGLARASDDAQMTQSGLIAGTPQYMSPEQAQGEPLDGRSDLFSLGSVLYTMCTGRPAFRAESTVATLRRVCDDTPHSIRELNPEIPEWLAEIVERLMAKSPDARIQSARELADLLSEHLAELQRPTGRRIAPPPTPAKSQPVRTANQHRRSMAIATLLCALLIGMLIITESTGLTQLFSRSGVYPPGEPSVPNAPDMREVGISEANGWKLFSPLGDCDVDADGGKVSMSVPGNRLHDLNPKPEWNNWDAPRLMRQVSGDFVAQVKVIESPKPLAGTAIHGRNSYMGAGLLVWVDENTFLRLERAGAGEIKQGEPHIQCEWFKEGTQLGLEWDQLPGGAVYLRIERRGRRLFLSWSSERLYWYEITKVANLKLPDTIQVGIAAVNATTQSFSPQFAELEIKTKEGSIVAPLLTVWGDGSSTPLFNGIDLTGWTTEPDQQRWRVEKGVLVGRGSGASLVSEKGLYSNFRLRARVRVSSEGDSGLYLRMRPDSTLPRGVRTGYEAQIIGPQIGPTDGHRTGSLYKFVDGQTQDVKMVVESHMQAGQWFDYEAIADGDRITLKVNGATVAEYIDPDPFLSGHIALDLFGNRGTVEFEKIEIKELASESSLKLITRFDLQNDKPTPPGWADAAAAVKVEDDAWRLENTTGQGNFWISMPTLLEGIPTKGLIVCKAKVKLKVEDPPVWGDLQLGDWGPDHYGYQWPNEMHTYRADTSEWKTLEVRYPAKAFHEKEPPQISVRFALHSDGVMWVKDVELLHSPEEPALTVIAPPAAPALSKADQEMLAIALKARDTAQALFDVGKISQDELLLAEVGYAEVQLKLPTTFQEEERLLRSIIANYKLIVAVQRQRVEAGVASPSSLLTAQKSLAEYERRLALITIAE